MPPRRCSAPGRGARRRAAGTPATVADSIARCAARLARARLAYGHGTASAADEAAVLAGHALGVRPERLPALAGRRPTRAQAAALERLVERRIAERKPAAYLVREAWLAGVRFYVDERVIVPRSHIAFLLRERLAPWLRDPRRVRSALDLCTGSGCLAVLLARALRRARIDAADISPDALAVARMNVARHRLTGRIRTVRSDLFAGLRGRRYDLIVCNPPYVTAGAMRRLPAEYRHEPRLALAGGRDGLACVRRVVASARRHLNAGGVIVVEVGAGRRRVERAFPRSAFLWPECNGGAAVFIATREDLPG
ncbi:MAG: 50S ribosomal protein L3 N(5)-glutamine methyltransferase [Burkholderiales bacterium]|nr:50S ribosomal protein L3 N(5)-glutamine methyltransferase [Burkholderiales bacterium]